SATMLLLAAMMARSANSFNVKLKYVSTGPDNSALFGTLAAATDDKLETTCDPLKVTKCDDMLCHQFERSIDVFSKAVTLTGLYDVSIETSAPYALRVPNEFANQNGVAFLQIGEMAPTSATLFCTGYNGFQGTWCSQLPDVSEAIQSQFWNGGANPGAGGNPGWGDCLKCSNTCYASTSYTPYVETAPGYCDYICDGVASSITNDVASSANDTKNGAVVGLLLGLASLTTLMLFVGVC
ncbi:MAG: hypothetical protein SGBAC_013276, partial [Bacillariaceae sp.]